MMCPSYNTSQYSSGHQNPTQSLIGQPSSVLVKIHMDIHGPFFIIFSGETSNFPLGFRGLCHFRVDDVQ